MRKRVLYFIVRYPTFSETYMHEELRAVRDDFETEIVTLNRSLEPRRDPFPHRLIQYRDVDLVYGPHERVRADFSSPWQRFFLFRVERLMRRFEPQVLHAHYFGLALLLDRLARRFELPWTLRTHSMDVLAEPEEKLGRLCATMKSPFCRRVLVFPGQRERLLALGAPAEKLVACWPVLNFARFHRPERRPWAGRVMCAGPAIPKKKHGDFVRLARNMAGSGLRFSLFAKGYSLGATTEENAAAGNVVDIRYADPDDMPRVYEEHDWLVYTADPVRQKVGLPVAIAEAQAAGVGVAWQELPGRRDEQIAFLGEAGHVFCSIDEVPAIISQPLPEPLRLAGIESARKSDVRRHIPLLTDAWGA